MSVNLRKETEELLNNVMKHSDARKAIVKLKREKGRVRISVKDNGQGFDAALAGKGFSPSGGFGLFSMRENLQHHGRKHADRIYARRRNRNRTVGAVDRINVFWPNDAWSTLPTLATLAGL